MLGRLVALVIAQAVFGIEVVPLAHHLVAIDLGDDGGGRDGVAALVPLNERLLGKGKVEGNGVDQHEIGGGIELLDGGLHGEARSLVDVDAVDSGGIDGGDGPGDGAFANALGEHFAAIRIDLLAVVEPANGSVGRKNDRACHDCAEQRAAADFVGAGDERETARAQFPFEISLALPARAFDCDSVVRRGPSSRPA